LLEQFFKNLLALDRERMALLRAKWYEGYTGFMEFLSGLGINKVTTKKYCLRMQITLRNSILCPSRCRLTWKNRKY